MCWRRGKRCCLPRFSSAACCICNGLKRKRIEFYGNPQSGKSVCARNAAALAGTGVGGGCAAAVYLACGAAVQLFSGKRLAAVLFGVCAAVAVFRQPENENSARFVLLCRDGGVLGGAGAADGAALCGRERHGGVVVCGAGSAVLGMPGLDGGGGHGACVVGFGGRAGCRLRVSGCHRLAAIHGGGSGIQGVVDVPQRHCGRAVRAA